MSIIPIIIFLLPLSLAIYVSISLGKRSQLWLEVFAGIISLMLFSYGVIFWLSVKETWILSLVSAISFAQFFGLLMFPIASGNLYKQLRFKSFLFDGQSSFSQKARSVRDSRLLSSLAIFIFFLISFGLVFYSIDFIDEPSQLLWFVGLSAIVAVKNAIDWKPSKV